MPNPSPDPDRPLITRRSLPEDWQAVLLAFLLILLAALGLLPVRF